eukprot:6485082-Pyramimonas_sp.AAC.1
MSSQKLLISMRGKDASPLGAHTEALRAGLAIEGGRGRAEDDRGGKDARHPWKVAHPSYQCRL